MIALMPGSIRTLGSTFFSGRRNSARREKAPLAHILLPFSGMGFQGDNRAKRNEGVPDAVDAGHNCVRNGADAAQIGRASVRERVCQYVSISGGAVSLKKNK